MLRYVERLGPVRAYREIRHDFGGVVLVLATGDLIASFGFSLIFPFLTIYLVSAFQATALEAGLVLSGYAVCSIFSGALGGWLADRIGRKPVMIVSVGVTGIVIVLMGQARDLVQIAILTVVLGLIDPAFVPAARAAIADVVDEARRPRAYGLLAVAAAVGWIAGPAIGAGLSELGYPFLFSVSGVIVGLYAIVCLRWLPETRPVAAAEVLAASDRAPLVNPVRRAGVPPEVETIDPHGPASQAAEPPSPIADPISMRRAVDPRVVFAAFLPIVVVVHAASFQWVTTVPIYAERSLGLATATWGLLFSINGILIVFFQLRVAHAADGRSKPKVMAVSSLTYAAGYGCIALVQDPAVALPALASLILLATIGEMLLFPIEPSFVSDLSPMAQRGRYQGILLGAAGLGSAVGPPIGGWLLDAWPGPLAWYVTLGSLVVAAVALWALGRYASRVHRIEELPISASA